MTAHPLDRPIWHALVTRQAHLTQGEGRALRYHPDYALFAAAADDSEEALADLGALIVRTGPAILLQTDDAPTPPGAIVEKRRQSVQMVAATLAPMGPSIAYEELGDSDAAEMLALATLTEPGPFFARTHQLGDFIGVRHQGRLIAMAGERMKLTGYTEVSGVCTHPDFRGRGLAAALTHVVASRIVARGEVPFLHAYAENTGAIALYEALGFRTRCEPLVTILTP